MSPEHAVPNHPLDPFTPQELTGAVEILRATGQVSEAVRFSAALPVEPLKQVVRDFQAGDAFVREIRLVGYDPKKAGSFDAHLSMDRKELLSFKRIEGGQAPIGMMDFIRVIQIVKEDPGWQAAMRKRGVEDFSLVQVDPWPAGGFPPEEIPEGTRMMRAISFVRNFKADNGYAHPVEGLMAFVDLDKECVARLDDYGVVPIPEESGNYDTASVGKLREDLRPIEITQPEGPSFEVDGHAIRWQKWNFRISLHPIQGLVLHDLGYEDGGRVRKILHRAALSDMVVPYSETSPMHGWKHVFDASEICMGSLANSLKLGCDCIGEIHYFDATMLGFNGEPVTLENAICMHEEDYGILWKHTDLHSREVEVRRSRRLVVSSIHTVGNYEYGFFWYFYLDGMIQMEVKLTGIVGVSAVEEAQASETSSMIAPHLSSPNHQHLFCFRLDFAVDGDENSIYEVNSLADPIGPENPNGTIFRAVATPLKTEQKAMRNVNSASSRYWKVVNPGSRNPLDQPVAYKLLPQATPTMFARDESVHARRAGFAKHNLWVTPYEPTEMAAAGEFTNLNPGPDGLPVYVENDRPIENTDLVVWHTFGLTHVPRPEDWPVMPVEYCGFSLMPVGFFERNPALDVPPSKTCSS
ncbi:primary-amine oxidase [Myxococcota bacterium]|nr:primary-amine oxidase [Myxococcota bacterium]